MAARRVVVEEIPEAISGPFREAVKKLATFVGAKEVAEGEVTITEFKAKYANILNKTNLGSLKVIKRNSHRYVILDEEQVRSLVQNARTTRSASDCLAGLDLPALTGDSPRSRVPSFGLVRAGRLPEQ